MSITQSAATATDVVETPLTMSRKERRELAQKSLLSLCFLSPLRSIPEMEDEEDEPTDPTEQPFFFPLGEEVTDTKRKWARYGYNLRRREEEEEKGGETGQDAFRIYWGEDEDSLHLTPMKCETADGKLPEWSPNYYRGKPIE